MSIYQKFDLMQTVKNAENYLTSMVDPSLDFLPYWMVQITENPAYARHVRVDDAELVASWYEALSCTMKMLGKDAKENDAEVLAGFKRHLMRSWGEHGLRFHEPYPWSNITHSSFHEMAYVLSALNRLLENEPENTEAEKRASELVRGMRSLVYERKIRTFWNGDYIYEDPIYEFPGDIYIAGEEFVPERITGRGEEAIRNGVLLHPLAVRAERFHDDVALDLAIGLANQIIRLSRHINHKGEYFGHVHSTVWIARGLIKLGKLTNKKEYLDKGYDIYRFTQTVSSSYGWVPEYANWHPVETEQCETCCIRDMIECALDLIDAGYDEWDLVNRFTRNALAQQQFTYNGFVKVDNTRPDQNGYTWHDMDKRMIGGWTGGGEANYMSLRKFRAIAGCCVGTAPQALHNVWSHIVGRDGDILTVNLPMDYEDENICVETLCPDEGTMIFTLKKDMTLRIRYYRFMEDHIGLSVNGNVVPLCWEQGMIVLPDLHAGDVVRMNHPLETRCEKETVQGKELTVYWRGSDVVRITPEGDHLRIYQRDLSIPQYLPSEIENTNNPVYTGPTK